MTAAASSQAILAGRIPGGAVRPARAIAPVLVMLAALAAVQLAAVLTGRAPVLEGLLIDTDSHMKLVRIEQLLATGHWYDGLIARSNFPEGETLHWTRLFDVIVIALAAPLFLFLDLRTALYWAGASTSPLGQMLTALAMIWAARPLVGGRAAGVLALVAFFTVSQPNVFGYALLGRADHHTLLMLILVLVFGAAMRALRAGEEGAPRAALRFSALAGLVAGAGIWASVELMIAAGACAAAFGVAWLLRGGAWLRANLAYAASLAGSVAVALVVERPPADLFAIENDRISMLHLAVGVAAVAFWLLILLLHGERLGRLWLRACLAAGCAVAVSAALAFAVPQTLSGPLSQMDPSIVPIWLDKVNEMQPLWPRTASDLGMPILSLGLGLVAVPYLAWSLIARRAHPAWLCWMCLAAGILATLPVALAYRRFAPYTELLFGLVLCEFLHATMSRIQGLRPVLRIAANALAIMVPFFSPLLIAAAVTKPAADSANADVAECRGKTATAFLTDPRSGFSGRPFTILTSVDLGPELLYRTPHRVVGTPYHRNASGIRDTYQALSGDAETARRSVDKRGIDIVLLCRVCSKRHPYACAAEQKFYDQLIRGHPPDWLAPVTLPPEVAAEFRMFRVVRPTRPERAD